ncbi:hypothetical protein HDC32_005457 [Pseudomonas sp. JAI120]|nr:hypothetical protein [Pseudomonas sp. SJZ073]MBB6315737.1 hypothetical protein [Pseudomonas sp. JAI120]
MAQNLLKSAVVTPLSETLINGLPRPKALWKISPFGTRAQNPEDSVKHLAVIAPWPPHVLRRRNDGFDRPTLR